MSSLKSQCLRYTVGAKIPQTSGNSRRGCLASLLGQSSLSPMGSLSTSYCGRILSIGATLAFAVRCLRTSQVHSLILCSDRGSILALVPRKGETRHGCYLDSKGVTL